MSWQYLGVGKEIEENGVVSFLFLALGSRYFLFFDDDERTAMIETVLALGLHHRLQTRKVDCFSDNVTYQLKFITFMT